MCVAGVWHAVQPIQMARQQAPFLWLLSGHATIEDSKSLLIRQPGHMDHAIDVGVCRMHHLPKSVSGGGTPGPSRPRAGGRRRRTQALADLGAEQPS